MTTTLFITALFTACYAMLAKRIAATVLTAPMVFIGFGVLLSATGLMPTGEAEEFLHLVAEVALIVLLFLDASQINLSALRNDHDWPLRMLVIGLPLSLIFGSLLTWAFFPEWPFIAIALTAALLAPTDAALGQAVVTNPVVPERVRRALTVESGLNDGLALPAILLFASLASTGMQQDPGYWAWFSIKQLVLGPVAGIILGFLGGRMLLWAKAHDLTSEVYEGVGAIALAGATYLFANEIGGNGFIAAFIGGLTFGNVVKGQCKFIYEFTESEGQLLSWGAFFLLGLVLVPQAVAHLSFASLGVILTSLLVVRPLAIWVSLIGTDASSITRLFFGWFGPRGLATALFALLVAKQASPEIAEPVLMLAINAVWISAFLHGVTAMPGAKWYAEKIALMGQCPETQPVENTAKPLRTQDLLPTTEVEHR